MIWRFWFVREDDGTPLTTRSGVPICVQGRSRAPAHPPEGARKRALERAQALADERRIGVCVKLQRGLAPSSSFAGPFLPASA